MEIKTAEVAANQITKVWKYHLTDEQIREGRRKFDDNLFAQAYYSDQESYSALFGNLFKRKDKGTAPSASTDDLGNIAEKAWGSLKKLETCSKKTSRFNRVNK